jgi:hypothetical protein
LGEDENMSRANVAIQRKSARDFPSRIRADKGLEDRRRKNSRDNVIAGTVGLVAIACVTGIVLWIGREEREIRKNMNTDSVPPQMAVPPPQDKKKKKAK